MIRITSKKHLFRRAGRAHPKGATEYPDYTFSHPELKAMRAEPMLVVEFIEEVDETDPPPMGDTADEPKKPVKGKKGKE